MNLITHLTQPYMEKKHDRECRVIVDASSVQPIGRVDKRQCIHHGNRWLRLPAYPPYTGRVGGAPYPTVAQPGG